MTKKSAVVLEFIRQYIIVHGFPPSYDDIAKGLQLRSRSNIHRLVHRLKKDGHLNLKAKKFRSIQLADKTVDQVNGL
jgi:repressor LexA